MYWKLLFTLIKTLTLNLPVPFLGLPTVTTGILIQVNLGIYWHGSCTTKWMSSRYVREIIIYIGNTYFHGNLLEFTAMAVVPRSGCVLLTCHSCLELNKKILQEYMLETSRSKAEESRLTL